MSRSRKKARSLWITLLLGMAATCAFAAPAIPNPSFEANTFTAGQGTVSANSAITGWTTNDGTRVGINPLVDGTSPFVDNGIVPHGTRVAFIRSEGMRTTLSTTITGLVAGGHYKVSMRLNCRAATGETFGTCRIGEGPAVTLGDVPVATGGGGAPADYKSFMTFFVASGPTAVMEMGNNTASDSTLLIDDFKIEMATPMQVTNANNDGPGSLRVMIAAAAATPAFNLITFAPALSGQILRLADLSINVGDASGLAIDGSNLPKGIKIAGNVDPFTTNSCFLVVGPCHLRGLSFEHCRGGPAIYSAFTRDLLLITRCSFIDCQASTLISNLPGAILAAGGVTVLQQCTLWGNVGNEGGAIDAWGGFTTLEHCTVVNNHSRGNGGGIYMRSSALVVMSHSILSDNTAATSGADIFRDNAVLYYPALNIVQFVAGSGLVLGTPAEAVNARMLDRITDGATETVSLAPDSPARNRVPTPNIRTDQRGRPMVGAADFGAYEGQRGTFSMAPGESRQEGAVSHDVFVQRTDGFEDAVTVKISASAGTASAADFTPFANLTVNFPPGQHLVAVPVQIKADTLVEANETLNISLSSPSAGTLLGSPTATTVTIIDGSAVSGDPDDKRPGPVVFTSPAAGASVNLVGDFITITGTASDNKGVKTVLLRFAENDEPFSVIPPLSFFQATLESPDAASTKWSFRYFDTGDAAKVRIEAQAIDGNDAATTPASTHSFKVLQPLQVAVGGNGIVSPAGYAPLSYRELGQIQSLTATPSVGHLFAGWEITGATLAAAGLNAVNLDRPTLHFYHRQNLRVKAKFVPNPFLNKALTGNFKGLIGATVPKINTEGLVDVTVGATGAFSAKLTVDGSVLNFAGLFDGQGKARFGTARALTALVPRAGRPSLRVRLSYDSYVWGLYQVIFASVEMLNFAGVVVENMSGGLLPAKGSVDPYFLGPAGASQGYNLLLDVNYSGSLPLPPMAGYGRVTLTKSGLAIFTDIALADGTSGLTASAFVDSANRISLYIPLYGGRGFFKDYLSLQNPPNSIPLAGSVNGKWGKPADYASHYYPEGWPHVVGLFNNGWRHVVTAGQSVLNRDGGGVLAPPSLRGNAELIFWQSGLLTAQITRRLNISTNDIVTELSLNDPTYSLAIDRATGLVRGSFLHDDGNMIPFQGITVQYGNNGLSRGFFMSHKPVPIDYSGVAGYFYLRGN